MNHFRWWTEYRARTRTKDLLKEARKRVKKGEGSLSDDDRNKLHHAIEDLQGKLDKDAGESALMKGLARLETLLYEKKLKKRKGVIFQYAESIGWAIAIALVIRIFLFEPFKIPTGSMIPTLQIEDHIFVAKSAYGIKLPLSDGYLVRWSDPERGDVVVFPFPIKGHEDYGKDFIKRVIGLPGDQVELKDNILYVNGKSVEGKRLEDTYPYEQTDPYTGRVIICDCIQQKETLGDHTFLTYHYAPASICPNRPNWPDKLRGWAWPPLQDQGPYTVPEDHVFVMGDNRDNSSDGREWGIVPIGTIRGKALVIWLATDWHRIFSRIP